MWTPFFPWGNGNLPPATSDRDKDLPRRIRKMRKTPGPGSAKGTREMTKRTPFGLKPVKLEPGPGFEGWRMLPDQEQLWKGDLVYREDGGRIVRPPVEQPPGGYVGPFGIHAGKVTHVVWGVKDGFAYVQKFKESRACP